ncbi:MAG: aromatic ring-hydroxylating dioxygenase subunit alpha [Gammaproteobacteria bacterium]|nr:aromatic ring-hydroxylating dioxygenase subunit alpha [Gammaproteobacteria bacterium]MDH3413843.1 aromatic ring-hydroxylating dioxygenase subunit alpha [Gammaproteobacteria bacterium]
MNHSLQQVLGAEALAAFEDPGPVSRGLPPGAYISGDFFQLEKASLFRNAWTFVGFAHELKQPGDAVPVTVSGQPVLLVCNKARQIKAFYNVCRHRCLKLVDAPCNVGRVLRCPYHSWTYSLDGGLKITPYFGGREPRDIPEGFDRGSRGLMPVRCGVWHDWVFVNLSGDAGDFDAFVAPLAKWMEDVDFAALTHLVTIDLGEVKTNWKLLMENFIEPYHVQFVHVSTTQQPLTDHYAVNESGCLGSAVDISRDPDAPVSDDTLSVSSRYLTLFPNFVLGRYYPDQIGVHLNVPLAADRTHQRRAIYATSPDAAAATQAEKLAKLWTAVHREDHAMCERLQEGRGSDAAADGGVLSPVWESSVLEFQRLVVDAMR